MNGLALGFLILFGLLIGVYTALARRKGAPPVALRPMDSFDNLPKTVGEAVESGRRLHIALGSGALGQADTATTVAGLNALNLISTVAVVSDKPPVITTTDGAAAFVAQDLLKQVYTRQHALERYAGDEARVAGLTPISYQAALAPMLSDETVAGNVILGPTGPEVALLTEAGQRGKVSTLAGSDNPATQAVLFAAADDVLLGEDVYAVSAYLARAEAQVASLQAQDWMRVIVIAAIVLGALGKAAGVF
jgi:hypothetical protein